MTKTGNTGTKVDVRERIISIQLSDGSYYHLDIPENEGIDSVDRVRFGKAVVERLICIANDGQPIDQNSLSDDEELALKKLVESDLDNEDWPELIKDKVINAEETAILTEDEVTPGVDATID